MARNTNRSGPVTRPVWAITPQTSEGDETAEGEEQVTTKVRRRYQRSVPLVAAPDHVTRAVSAPCRSSTRERRNTDGGRIGHDQR